MIKIKNVIAEWAAKPVIQFLGIGLLMFLINTYVLQADSSNNEDDYIVYLNAGEVKSMQEIWTSQWKRPPTEIEMEGMINQKVEETILFKEAVKIGLDKNDDIIRQRLAQKLEFLSNDIARPDSATTDEIREYFDLNVDNYTNPRTVSMTQLFIDQKKYGASLEEEIEIRLGKLKGLDETSSIINRYGDQFALQKYFPDYSELELGKLFGSKFAATVFEIKTNRWYGPIDSQYGMHLVYISAKSPAKVPEFNTVKEIVTEDLQLEKQEKLNKQYIDGILSRYTVIIEDKEGV